MWQGQRVQKTIGHAKSPLEGIKRTSTKIEAHVDMAEELVRELDIEEALKMEIKDTLAHKLKSCVQMGFSMIWKKQKQGKTHYYI